MSSDLRNGIFNGFIDSTSNAKKDYIPSLLTNEPEEGLKVLCEVTTELSKCVEFKFCVAFLTMSGVQVLINTFNNLKEKNIRGTIIVSQYQNFTEPKALRKILEYDNIELRIVTTDTDNMHSKGYIFKHENDEYSIIVGSSNLTQNALCYNKEWNVKLSSLSEGSYAKNVLDRFEETYNASILVTEDWIDAYEKVYKALKDATKIDDTVVIEKDIKPNSMQEEALRTLNVIRASGAKKALAISSTGTGKTILCALDVKQVEPKKVLFVIHRENICSAALRTFKMVLGNNIKACIYGGSNKGDAHSSDYVFAMVQTLSKKDNLETFDKDEFDYIIFDEAHHLGAPTTRRIFDYFEPKFILGMTATPERMDGYDIYGLFDHNIACEIRLNDAMKENLICPFHYYGVADITVDGKLVEDDENFANLATDERLKHILKKIEEYGYSGEKVKGLVFVSLKEEARWLSDEFNKHGYKTIALTGDDTEEKRVNAINMLESDDERDCLDYIFTVDIFNEGIDIQKVNQVVMLRPTESAIIFVQQLGRGLRKSKDKEYLVVIDFIGNYDNDFLIPVALSGDTSYNKDNIRRYVTQGTKTLYGPSTIEFEKIVEKKIFEKIDKANFSDLKIIKDSYTQLKNKIGKIPCLNDFSDHGYIDVEKIFDKCGSYHNFLKKYEREYLIQLSNEEELFLELVSTKYGNAKKVFEALLIKTIINNPNDSYEEIFDKFKDTLTANGLDSCLNNNLKNNLLNQMNGDYWVSSDAKKYSKIKFINNGKIDTVFFNCLSDDDFYNIINELLDYIIKKHMENYYGKYYKNTLLVLNKKYTYEDVLRLLNFEKNDVALNIGGYKYDNSTNTLPVFVNYEKGSDISASINYHDRFLDPDNIITMSKGKRTMGSTDVKNFINAKENGTKIYLFVRKNKDDKCSKEFYFLGEMTSLGFKDVTMENGDPVVEMHHRLSDTIRNDIYDYIANK